MITHFLATATLDEVVLIPALMLGLLAVLVIAVGKIAARLWQHARAVKESPDWIEETPRRTW